MRSLKSRLMVGMIGSVVLLLISFDIIVYNVITRALQNQFDVSLMSAAHLMCAAVEWDENDLDFEFDIRMTPEYSEGAKSAYYEFRLDNGNVIRKSPSLGSDESIGFTMDDLRYEYKTFQMTNRSYVRAVSVRFVPRIANSDGNIENTSPTLVLTIAKSIEDMLMQLRFLKYILVAATAVIIAFACGVAATVVKKTLAPLTSVAAQIESIGEENLGNRISGENLPSEVFLIQNRINSLLTRLETSFERERTFNANVAHELRTPLAGIRSIIDVTLAKNRDIDEYRSALSELIPIVDSMQKMSQKLLMLTKIESGQMTLNLIPQGTAQLIDKCWLPFAAKAADARILFENHLNADIECITDDEWVSIVFSNLLDNAVEHTNQGGRIWVTGQRRNKEVEIIIENTGNQLTEQQVKKVFDCYWRGDASRSRTDIHSGLGLALAKRIVGLLGGGIRAEVSNGLFSVRICLPVENG